MPVFFYGTLMDGDVLSVVLARPVAAAELEPAVLPGFRRVFVDGRNYPVLQPHPHSHVAGLLAHGLDDADRLRLVLFEGREYHLCPCAVVDSAHGRHVPALVFLGDRSVRPTRHEWHLAVWRRRHKRGFLRRAADLMERYGTQALLGRGGTGLPALAARKAPKHLSGKPPRLGRISAARPRG